MVGIFLISSNHISALDDFYEEVQDINDDDEEVSWCFYTILFYKGRGSMKQAWLRAL